jgi:hypothetical protein
LQSKVPFTAFIKSYCLLMFYHINAFKQTEKKKYQLDFLIEGDIDDIKKLLDEEEVITLSIDLAKEEDKDQWGNIHATIKNTTTINVVHQLIMKHEKVAQACLMLIFF